MSVLIKYTFIDWEAVLCSPLAQAERGGRAHAGKHLTGDRTRTRWLPRPLPALLPFAQKRESNACALAASGTGAWVPWPGGTAQLLWVQTLSLATAAPAQAAAAGIAAKRTASGGPTGPVCSTSPCRRGFLVPGPGAAPVAFPRVPQPPISQSGRPPARRLPPRSGRELPAGHAVPPSFRTRFSGLTTVRAVPQQCCQNQERKRTKSSRVRGGRAEISPPDALFGLLKVCAFPNCQCIKSFQ